MRRTSGLLAVRLVALGVVLCAAVPCGAAAAAVPEPPGYRMENFRAPVPATLAGATVVSLERVQELAAGGQAVLIDVLPRPPRPRGLTPRTIWRPRPRDNIPGSVWLPNTGFGALSDHVERYFREALERLTGSDRSRPILFYCLADCWMSWNAAKRAVAYGYRSVYWFPEGTDAWTAEGLPTERSEPEPGWEPE